MDIFNLVGKINLPEINDASFPDQEQMTYRYFIEKINDEGIIFPFMIPDNFKNVIQKNKKIPLFFLIPESSPVNVINDSFQKKNSIRELIYELFPLYLDDIFEFEVSFNGKLIHSGYGKINNCYIPTEKLKSLQFSNNLEMLSIKMILNEIGNLRKNHEDNSLIFDSYEEKKRLLTKEKQIDLFKKIKNKDILIERLKLYGLSHLETKDDILLDIENKIIPNHFDTKELIHLRWIYNHFAHPYSNDKLLAFNKEYEIQLNKMRQWLNRTDKDGKTNVFDNLKG